MHPGAKPPLTQQQQPACQAKLLVVTSKSLAYEVPFLFCCRDYRKGSGGDGSTPLLKVQGATLTDIAALQEMESAEMYKSGAMHFLM